MATRRAKGHHQMSLPGVESPQMCAWPGCPVAAVTMCALCGRSYCREHCQRASLFTVFRSRTDLPEDLIDLLNGIDDPRARVWMCNQCEAGVPIPGGRSWG